MCLLWRIIQRDFKYCAGTLVSIHHSERFFGAGSGYIKMIKMLDLNIVLKHYSQYELA